jgi:hypothetical protein
MDNMKLVRRFVVKDSNVDTWEAPLEIAHKHLIVYLLYCTMVSICKSTNFHIRYLTNSPTRQLGIYFSFIKALLKSLINKKLSLNLE